MIPTDTNAYETLLILKPSLSDEEVGSGVERVKTAIRQKEGEVVWVENMGKKKLAYEIQKEKRGIFVLVQFKGNRNTLSELTRVCRLHDAIMRFMMVKIKLKALRSSDNPNDTGREKTVVSSPNEEGTRHG